MYPNSSPTRDLSSEAPEQRKRKKSKKHRREEDQEKFLEEKTCEHEIRRKKRKRRRKLSESSVQAEFEIDVKGDPNNVVVERCGDDDVEDGCEEKSRKKKKKRKKKDLADDGLVVDLLQDDGPGPQDTKDLFKFEKDLKISPEASNYQTIDPVLHKRKKKKKKEKPLGNEDQIGEEIFKEEVFSEEIEVPQNKKRKKKRNQAEVIDDVKTAEESQDEKHQSGGLIFKSEDNFEESEGIKKKKKKRKQERMDSSDGESRGKFVKDPMTGERKDKRNHEELVIPKQTNNHVLEKRKKKDKKEKAAGEEDQSGGLILKAEVICEKSEDFKKKKKKQERKESSDQRNKGEVIEDVIKVEERKMEMHHIELVSPKQMNNHVLEKRKKKDKKEKVAGDAHQCEEKIFKEEVVFEAIENKKKRKKKQNEEVIELVMAGESEKKRHHTELVSPQQTNNHDLEKRKKKDKKEKAAGEADQSGGQILKAEVICDESEDFKKKKKKRERMESSDQRNQGEVIEHITARECEKKRHNIELDSPQQTNYHVLEKKKKKDIKENAAGEEVQKQIFQVVEILKEEIIFEEIEAIEKRERKKKRKEERMDLSDQMSAEREKKRRKQDRERLDDEAPPPKSQHLTGHCKRKNAEDGKNWLEEEAERLRLEAKDAEREMCIQNLIEQARNRLKKKKKKRDKKRDKVRHHVPIASDSTLVKESVEKDKSSSRPIKLFPLFNLAKGVRQKKDSVGSVVSESHLDNDDPKRRPEVDFEFDPCQSAVVSTQIGFDQKISQQKSQNFVEAKILENFDHVVKTSHSTHADQLGKVSTNPSIKQGGMDAVDDNNCFDGNSTDFDNKELNTAFKGLNFKKPSVVKSTSSDSPSLKDQSQEDVEADVAGIGTPDVVAGTCADESYRNDPAESDKSRSVCQSSVRIDDLNLSSSSFELDQVLDGVESSVSDDKVELGFDMGDVESVVEPEFFADHGKMDLMLSTVNLPLLDIEDHKERKHAESSSPENFRPFTQLPVSPAKNLNATPVEEDSEDDVVRRAEEFGSKSE